jgi:hypothetical protein
LSEFVDPVIRVLKKYKEDSIIAPLCCRILRNMVFTMGNRVARASDLLVEASHFHPHISSSIAIALAVIIGLTEYPIRIKSCKLALDLFSDTRDNIGRAAGVTLLSSVLRCEDALSVFEACDAAKRIWLCKDTIPMRISWIRPLFTILCTLGRRYSPSPNLAASNQCCICMDALADRQMSACAHSFCSCCLQTFVRKSIGGDGAECDDCCNATIPACPLCRAEFTATDIFASV